MQPQQPLPTARQPDQARLPCDKETATKQGQADRPRRWGPQNQAEQQQYQANFLATHAAQQSNTAGHPTAPADSQDTTPQPPQQPQQTQHDQQQLRAESLGTPAAHTPQQGNTPHPQHLGHRPVSQESSLTWEQEFATRLQQLHLWRRHHPAGARSQHSVHPGLPPDNDQHTYTSPRTHTITTAGAALPSTQSVWQLTRLGHNQFLLEPYQPNSQATTFYHDFQQSQPTAQQTQPPHQLPQSTGHEQQQPRAEQPQQQAHQQMAEATQEQCRETPQEQGQDAATPEDPEEATFMQRPGQHRPAKASQHDRAEQAEAEQSQRETARPATANTQTTAKPAATKSKAKAPARQTCLLSEEPSSSSNTAKPTAAHNNTHIATVLTQQPPFTAMQHGMPLLRDLLAYQVRAHPDNQPTKPAAMAAPPPPPPTLEELQLSLQIAQALTSHIQTITSRILSANSQPLVNHHSPHPNDVITIDSQDTQEEVDPQPAEQPPPQPQPPQQVTTPPDVSATTQQHTTQEQRGANKHLTSTQNTTHTISHQSTSSQANAPTNSSTQSEQATQPWWVLGIPANRSRSPPRAGQHLDLVHAASDQRMTQQDDEEENLDGSEQTTGQAY